WTRTQWVGVGDGDVVGDDGAIFHGDLYRTAEGLFVEVQRVVAASPFRIFYGRDLVPQFNGVFTLRTLWSIRINVVPCAILQCDREDVHDRVVQGFAGCGGIHLFWVVGSGTDHVVGVVGGLNQNGLNIGRIGGFRMFLVQFTCQVDPGLCLVFGGVFLGVRIQDRAFCFALCWQRYRVVSVRAVQQPRDETVFAFINGDRGGLAAQCTVDGFDSHLGGKRWCVSLPRGNFALA